MDHRERFAELEDAIRIAQEGHQASIWTALPGYILSFDPKAVTVEVQPTIQGVVQLPDGNAKAVDLPTLPDVPVVFPRGGGVTFTFPIQKHDECLVVFSSRCIDSWWQSGGVQLAPEFRMHDLSDALCFVGPQSQPNKIDNISTNSAQIRTDDGKAYIEWVPGNHNINLNTPGDVNATVGGNVDAQITGTMTGKAASWHITGDVTINGSVTTTGDVVAAGVSLDHHTHTGDSGGTTSQPL